MDMGTIVRNSGLTVPVYPCAQDLQSSGIHASPFPRFIDMLLSSSGFPSK